MHCFYFLLVNVNIITNALIMLLVFFVRFLLPKDHFFQVAVDRGHVFPRIHETDGGDDVHGLQFSEQQNGGKGHWDAHAIVTFARLSPATSTEWFGVGAFSKTRTVTVLRQAATGAANNHWGCIGIVGQSVAQRKACTMRDKRIFFHLPCAYSSIPVSTFRRLSS